MCVYSVAKRQAVLGQLLLQARAGRSRLDPRRSRDRVDLKHAVQSLDVDRHDAAVAIADERLDAADGAGAAAERDHRRPLRNRPAQNPLDVALIPRQGDHVRRVVEAAAEPAHHVPVRGAV